MIDRKSNIYRMNTRYRYRIARSGAFFTHARVTRSALRDRWLPGCRFSDMGLRLCLVTRGLSGL